MTAAKYLVIAYLCGALVTLGRTVFATVDAATCLESVGPCMTAVRAVAWTGIDWPLYWGLQFAGPESDAFPLPTGLIPMAVLSFAAATAGLGMLRTHRTPAKPRNDEKTRMNTGRTREDLYPSESAALAWCGESGDRHDQHLPLADR